MSYHIPQTLKSEHTTLHRNLSKLSINGETIRTAAKAVEDALHPHIDKEETIAFPPLGLLPNLIQNRTPDTSTVLKLVDKFKMDLPTFIEEHKLILKNLNTLLTIAKEEGNMDVSQLVREFRSHIQAEEEIYYPTSILIGEYLRAVQNH